MGSDQRTIQERLTDLAASDLNEDDGERWIESWLRETAAMAQAEIARLSAALQEARKNFGETEDDRNKLSIQLADSEVALEEAGFEISALHGDLSRKDEALDAMRQENERLTRERDNARANADFLRESIGECHLMLSRNTVAYQLRQDWDATSLPSRLRVVMATRDLHESALTRCREALIRWRDGLASLKDILIFAAIHGAKGTDADRQRWDTLRADTKALLAEAKGRPE